MKSGITAVVLACIVVVAGIAYSFIHDDNPVDKGTTVTAKPNISSRVVQVDELAKSPEDFRGEFVLRGVVAGVRKTDGVFAVIDSREFESCEVLTCAANTIPVKFNGYLPDPKTIVEITGRVIRGKKGLVIEAKRVEVVK
jgi:hypothetical protein